MSSAHRGECVTTGGLYRPTHLCVAHFELHKKKKKVSYSILFGVVRLGGVWSVGGGGGSMFKEVAVCMGFQRGPGVISGLSQPRGKKLLSSLAERALMLRYRLPDGRS